MGSTFFGENWVAAGRGRETYFPASPAPARALMDPGGQNGKDSIDLLVNTYERTYRDVLAPRVFPGIEEQNQICFSQRTVVINNVLSVEDARARAERLIGGGEIDRFVFVSEFLDTALRITGMSRDDLGRFPHFVDWGLVTVSCARSPWLLHWDAEVTLEKPVNWIGPAIERMKSDESVLVANPSFDTDSIRGGIRKGLYRAVGDFALGYGFSDQVFLARTERLARPIYKEKCLASLRFPLAHILSSFEMRIDAYMRNHRLQRAIYLPAVYRHPAETEGSAYPAEMTFMERLRKIRNEYLHRKLRSRNVSRVLEWIGKSHLRV